MSHRHAVLLVEDHDDTREGMELLIQRELVEVVAVSNGREALERLRAGLRPCFVLLDLFTPEMDGLAFRRAQLADPDLASIPVAVLSGGGLAVEADMRQLGVTLFLRKPPDMLAVLAAVRDHCAPASAA
jgi:CheY-like chemotaxis protein